MTNSVLEKLDVLQALSRSGSGSEGLARSLDKIIDLERERLQEKLEELTAKLRIYEESYARSSAEFQKQFQAGTLGDEMDFFEWSVIYELWQVTQHRLEIFESLDQAIRD